MYWRNIVGRESEAHAGNGAAVSPVNSTAAVTRMYLIGCSNRIEAAFTATSASSNTAKGHCNLDRCGCRDWLRVE